MKVNDMDIIKIKRKEWLNGDSQDPAISMLLNSTTQTKCCLGFLAIERGFNEKEISDVSTPANLFLSTKKSMDEQLINFPEGRKCPSGIYNSNVADALMTINDQVNLSDETRIM